MDNCVLHLVSESLVEQGNTRPYRYEGQVQTYSESVQHEGLAQRKEKNIPTFGSSERLHFHGGAEVFIPKSQNVFFSKQKGFSIHALFFLAVVVHLTR